MPKLAVDILARALDSDDTKQTFVTQDIILSIMRICEQLQLLLFSTILLLNIHSFPNSVLE